MQESPCELGLDTVLEQAIAHPEDANLLELWQHLEQWLQALPFEQRLWVAGRAIAQIAEVYANRAERWLTDWEYTHIPPRDEPVLTRDLLSSFLRQTMTLNLDEIVEEPLPQVRRPRQSADESDESIVGVVDKGVLLSVVDELEQLDAKEHALAVAHREDVSSWIAAIAQWMNQHAQPEIPLLELQRSLQMPLIEVWLALLLGGYPLESRGQFYDTTQLWVISHLVNEPE